MVQAVAVAPEQYRIPVVLEVVAAVLVFGDKDQMEQEEPQQVSVPLLVVEEVVADVQVDQDISYPDAVTVDITMDIIIMPMTMVVMAEDLVAEVALQEVVTVLVQVNLEEAKVSFESFGQEQQDNILQQML